MAKCVMKQLRRGPTLKLNFSVMRQKSDNTQISTGCIDIDNLAKVVMKFKGLTNSDLQIGIKMKKTEQAKNLSVPMVITTGNFEDKFFCSYEWVETEMTVKTFDSSLSFNTYSGGYNSNQEVLLYNFEVNITIQAMSPTPISSMVTTGMYEDTEGTDFILAVPDGTVPVHKSILRVHSDMLRTMLRCGEWTETKEGFIKVKGVSMKTLEHLKRYMYLGILPDEEVELMLLMLIASFYLMDRMKADCIEKLVNSLQPDDFEDLVEFACLNNMPDLMKAILFQTSDDILTNAYKSAIENKMPKYQ